MEPSRNRYRIVGFWKDEHRVLVYYPEAKVERMIILPIDGGRYPEGVNLDNYIMSFFPGVYVAKPPVILDVENRAYIEAMVTEKYGIKAAQLEKRDKLLAMRYEALSSSDWTQLPDVLLVMDDEDKKRWKNFRQELRDITKQPGWPTDVDWPKRPYIFGVTVFNE